MCPDPWRVGKNRAAGCGPTKTRQLCGFYDMNISMRIIINHFQNIFGFWEVVEGLSFCFFSRMWQLVEVAAGSARARSASPRR